MTAAKDTQRLAEIPLFAGLSGEELGRVGELLHERTYPAGTHVVAAEQPGEAVYFVVAGKLRIYLEQADGSEVTFAFLGPGDVLGEMSLLDEGVRSADAVTLEPTTLLWMDRASFQRCITTLPVLTVNLVRQLTGRLRQANEQIKALSTLDVRGRVVRQLRALAEQYGEAEEGGAVRIPLPLTQSDIAEMVGATRERVNRVMVSLRKAGALEVTADHHIVLHLEALRGSS